MFRVVITISGLNTIFVVVSMDAVLVIVNWLNIMLVIIAVI